MSEMIFKHSLNEIIYNLILYIMFQPSAIVAAHIIHVTMEHQGASTHNHLFEVTKIFFKLWLPQFIVTIDLNIFEVTEFLIHMQ